MHTLYQEHNGDTHQKDNYNLGCILEFIIHGRSKWVATIAGFYYYIR